MAKRKLTRRQAWRINKIQQERTARAEKKATNIEEELQGGELGAEQQGLVISHFGTQIDVEALDGPLKGQIKRCHFRTNLGSIVTGDTVVWRDGDPIGVIVAVLPRHSLLSRPNNFGELKPVAANIDTLVITIAPEPTPFHNLIDRYMVAAETLSIEPILLLNKTDLINEDNRPNLAAMLAGYEKLGYRIIRASTKNQDGLLELKQFLQEKISIFVGQSGVGKSSLINQLLPGSDIKTGALSAATAKGTHTTTTARLYHFPDGGDLIDSPGIREFALWHITPDELLEGFREFRPFIGHCRFRDCHHEREPGCALLEALQNGDIDSRRMESYRLILNSLDANSN